MDKAKRKKKGKKFVRRLNHFLNRLPQLDQEKLLNPKFWFVIVLSYLSYINFFILKTTPEIIFIQFFVLVIIFNKIRSKEFAKTWIPFISLFLLYEFLRGYVDDMSPFYKTTLFWIYNLEVKIFGTLPTRFLQQHLDETNLLTSVSIFFYTIFFYYSFLVAFIIWYKYPKIFGEYFKKFLTISFIGLLVFFLIPTAPPWMVNEITNINIKRYIYDGNSVLQNFDGLTLYQYFIFGNKVAALPSLHVAWPIFSTLFLVKKFKSRYLYLLFVIPFIIAFSVILTAEHYVIDIVAGWILAWVFTLNQLPWGYSSRNQTSAK